MCISKLRYYWKPNIELMKVADSSALSMSDSTGHMCLRKMIDSGSPSTFDGKEGRIINCITCLKCNLKVQVINSVNKVLNRF